MRGFRVAPQPRGALQTDLLLLFLNQNKAFVGLYINNEVAKNGMKNGGPGRYSKLSVLLLHLSSTPLVYVAMVCVKRGYMGGVVCVLLFF